MALRAACSGIINIRLHTYPHLAHVSPLYALRFGGLAFSVIFLFLPDLRGPSSSGPSSQEASFCNTSGGRTGDGDRPSLDRRTTPRTQATCLASCVLSCCCCCVARRRECNVCRSASVRSRWISRASYSVIIVTPPCSGASSFRVKVGWRDRGNGCVGGIVVGVVVFAFCQLFCRGRAVQRGRSTHCRRGCHSLYRCVEGL